jgi:hypothetical protein
MQRLVLLSLSLLFCASAMADTPLPPPGSGQRAHATQGFTIQDLQNRDKFEIDVPMLPGDGYFGVAPRISLYGGFRNFSMGVVVPMTVASVDNEDTSFLLGNITLDLRGRLCRERRGISVCFAGGFATGFGVVDIDATDPSELAAVLVAVPANQDLVFSAPQSVVIRPVLATQVHARVVFLHAELGVPVVIPAFYDSSGNDPTGHLNWAIAAGANFADLIVPIFEFRGMHFLSAEEEMYFINVGARLLFGQFRPHLRLGIPLNDLAQLGDSNDIQIEVGMTVPF